MNNIEQLYSTCVELKTISSTNDKKAFLEKHKDNEDFTALLKFLLNPRIVTGISKAKLNKKVVPVPDVVGDMDSLYYYLIQNNTGKDCDIAVCQAFIELHKDYKDFLSSIITKTFKLGVDTKLCNTVYGKDFIPVHEVMLGSPRDKLRLKKGEEFYLTQKLNGVRCTYVDGELISRQGISFRGLEHIIHDIKVLEKIFKCSMVFDGELIRKNVNSISDNENFRIGTGIINSDDGDKSCIQLVLFDCLPLNDFRRGKSQAEYAERKNWLVDCENTIKNKNLHNIDVVECVYFGSDLSKIDECLALADKLGWEGLMLNHANGLYECKRSTKLIKIKTFKFSDLCIVGYEEGEGKYTGMLGAVVVEYKGSTANVGSGFTDEQRMEYWTKRDELIGKIVEVKYKEETTDKKTGLKSMQFPTWVQMRPDRNSVSYE